MKKILVLLILTTISIYGQSGWFALPGGTNTFLWEISFVNSNTGYIASDGGKVLKTTNSGTNWIMQNLTPSANVYEIQFFNSETGFTCGSQGNFYKTTNGGTNWNFLSTPTANAIQALHFFDINSGLIGSGSSGAGEIYKTTNGGTNWTQYGQSVFLSYVMGFSFPDANTGYAACYNGTMGKTTNAGVNWMIQNTGLSSSSPLFSVYFVDVNTGFGASSGGEIIKTINGGLNWNIVFNTTYAVVDIFLPDVSNGYAVGGNFTDEVVFRTTNGGINWVSEVLPFTGHANSVFFTSVNEGYITCEGGIIYKTTNGGNPIGIKPISEKIPDKLYLYQNYPNPFNPSTNIRFDVPESGIVTLEIYNMLGKKINELFHQTLTAGTYSVKWDGSNYPSGVYLYKLILNNNERTGKMVLIK